MTGPVCGEVIGEPCGFEVECQLLPDHEGDHYAEVSWPNTPRPSRPPIPSPIGELITQVWSQALVNALKPSPV